MGTEHPYSRLVGNRIAEYLYDPVSGSSELLREYVWMDGQAVAVIEGGEVFFIRTDHIGRPVFATDPDGVKVWEASYLPFGGVHVSTGAINLRFPGQWFQSESPIPSGWWTGRASMGMRWGTRGGGWTLTLPPPPNPV